MEELHSIMVKLDRRNQDIEKEMENWVEPKLTSPSSTAPGALSPTATIIAWPSSGTL